MSTIELQVADRFPAGTKVGAYPRVHDFFTPGQTPAAKTATVAKDGTLKISGLVEHGPYFLAAEVDEQVPTPRGPAETKVWRSIAITASNPGPAHDRDSTNAQAEAEAQARQRVVQSTSIDLPTAPGGGPQIVVGPRGTENTKPAAVPPIARTIPFPKIEDQKANTPLRSHTETGEAHPVPKDERQPKPSQDDVAKGTKQRSDTPRGEATPVDPGEPSPAVSQEEISARTPQASDTETGEATPVQAEEPRSTRKRSKPTKSKTRQAKRQKADKAVSTGKAQARAEAAGTTKKRASSSKRAAKKASR